MNEYAVTVINPFTKEPITLNLQMAVTGELTVHGTQLIKVQAIGTFCMNGELYDPMFDPNMPAEGPFGQ